VKPVQGWPRAPVWKQHRLEPHWKLGMKRTQLNEPAQVLSARQGWPLPPAATHVFWLLQTSCLSHVPGVGIGFWGLGDEPPVQGSFKLPVCVQHCLAPLRQ
jgi:hypothetical protein